MDRSYRGRIGYVSPAAEFTPKTVETPELRTQLVYRLRIRIENPDDSVRQGMPVTIRAAGAPMTNALSSSSSHCATCSPVRMALRRTSRLMVYQPRSSLG